MSLRSGPLHRGHRGRVREILAGTSVFREEELDVAIELFDESFPPPGITRGDMADYEWRGAFPAGDDPAGFACFGPTPGTEGTYDLYWIAVHPAAHGTGAGSLLMEEVEQVLALRGARLVVVETSSRMEYAAARRFYEGRGYRPRARIHDFYAVGDDRVIYTKRVHPPAEPHRHE